MQVSGKWKWLEFVWSENYEVNVWSFWRRLRSWDKRSQACWISRNIPWAFCFSSGFWKKMDKLLWWEIREKLMDLLDIDPDAIDETSYDIEIQFHFEKQYFEDSMPRKKEHDDADLCQVHVFWFDYKMASYGNILDRRSCATRTSYACFSLSEWIIRRISDHIPFKPYCQ